MCILVSLIGIPYTILTLKSVGEAIVKLINKVVTTFGTKVLNRIDPEQLHVKSAVILFLFMITLMTVCGWLQMPLEGWTFVEGIYFWFITFSTIGFGDYLPHFLQHERISQFSVNASFEYYSTDASKDPIAVVLAIIYVLIYIFGLCVVSSVLNCIVAALEERKRHLHCPGCLSRKIQDHPENEQSNAPEQGETNITYLSMEKF